MVCRRGLRIIKLITYFTFLVLSILKADLAVAENSGALRGQQLMLEDEQLYWKKWIVNNGGVQCPLQPFVFSYSQDIIAKTDNLIRGLADHENDALFVRVNIDNGILNVVYLAWDDSKSNVDFVEVKGLAGPSLLRIRSVSELSAIAEIAKLADKDGVVDIKNSNILDADSIYLSVRHGVTVSRFATYGMRFNVKGSEDFFPIYVSYILRQASKPRSESRGHP